MVEITFRFGYPWNDESMNENEIRDCILELSPEEILTGAKNAGEPINVDVEVY